MEEPNSIKMVIKGGEGGCDLGECHGTSVLGLWCRIPAMLINMDDGSTRAAPLAGADITNSNTSSAPGH